MTRPVVGIIGNHYLLNDDYPVHAGGLMNSEAISVVSKCMPMLIPSNPKMVTVEELMSVCDGFLLTGGRPNVHAEEYGESHTEYYGDVDRCRDAITLPWVRACVERQDGQTRLILHLRYEAGFSWRLIAEAVGGSAASVRMKEQRFCRRTLIAWESRRTD